MTEPRRKPRADKGHLRLTQRDRDGMLFIGEQSGVRRDQMPRYLGRHSPRATKKPGEVGATTAQGILERWCTLDWVQSVPIYKNEPDWLYLTEKGLRALNLPYHPWTPKRGSQLEHMYWVNEVRLLLEDLYPHGRWVSERHIRHTRTMTHYPDAEFALPNVPKPIAIEVERSLKDSARLDDILPWLAARYENTWYFAVQHDVLVRLRAQRTALPPSQRERIFLSRYDERNQRWHTDLGQAPPRSQPVELDHRRSQEVLKRTEQPVVSEVLQEIADEWPPPGDQFGSKRLPPLSPAWMPQTFEEAVEVARRLLTPSDEALLREMQGFQQSKKLWEWHQHLEEQLGLNAWVTWSGSGNEYSSTANRALWRACGQRNPAEIVFQLMEEIWWQFQNPLPIRRSHQLVRSYPLPPLPREKWPSTPEEAVRQARALLSPFEILWLHTHYWRSERRDEKFPDEGWIENLLDQFGLRPPQRKETQEEWNEALWRAAGTSGVAIKEQHFKVDSMLRGVIHQVVRLLEQEAKIDESSGAPQASSQHHQPSMLHRLSLCIKLLGGAGTLVGGGMLALGGKPLLSFVLDSVILLLGFGVFALGLYLAHRGQNSTNQR
jgi:hypothetical protein